MTHSQQNEIETCDLLFYIQSVNEFQMFSISLKSNHAKRFYC